jgi:PAS domain S-box-containing protein
MTEAARGAASGKEQFAAFLEAVPGAIISVESEGTIVLVNSQAESLFGYQQDELVGKSFEVLVPGAFRDDPSRQRPHDSHDPASRWVGAVMVLAGRRKDGSEFPAEVSLASSHLDGRPVVSAAIRATTEYKRGDATFRGVVESAEDAVLGVDPGGLIALVNAEAEDLFGYTRAELIDQPVELIIPQTAVDPSQQGVRHNGNQLNRALGAGTPLAGKRKDGSEFPAEIALASIDTVEGPLVSAAIRDASDRVEVRREQDRAEAQGERDILEAQLHQSHRLESLGQLAGGVAHDFNNLLAAILNYVGFVSEEINNEIAARPDSEHLRLDAVLRDVSQIGAAAQRAAGLTRQLLAFARRDVRKPEIVDIDAIVREVETLLRRTIGEHVELITRGAPDPAPVRADRGQIEQILLNLAVNGRDAMPTGGTLSVETDNVVVDEDYAALHPNLRAGPHTRLRVSDTGIGMDRDTVERAFEPFFSTKPKDKGTGLGLATVYGIVTQTAGVVSLESEAGEGTTVTILLPNVSGVVTAPGAPLVVGRRQGDETILVVEDEDLVLDVATRILTQHGYRVLSATSGAEALELIHRHGGTIHLLLTDVVMPGFTGSQVAEQVSKIRPEIRVLYMSGYPESMITPQGVIDQKVPLVSKPFTAPDLLEHVRAVLDS